MKKIKRYVVTEADSFVKTALEHNFERLDDFAASRKYSVMQKVTLNDGREALRPTRYVGIIMLKDGTQIEILPQVCIDREENIVSSKILLLRMYT